MTCSPRRSGAGGPGRNSPAASWRCAVRPMRRQRSVGDRGAAGRGPRQPDRQRDRARRARRSSSRRAPARRRLGWRLPIRVAGLETRPGGAPGPAALIARLGGRRRHGHGLRVVRRLPPRTVASSACIARRPGPRRSSSCRWSAAGVDGEPARPRARLRPGGRCARRSRRRRSPTATAPASPAAMASCGPWSSPRSSLDGRPADRSVPGRHRARAAAGAGPVRAAGGAGRRRRGDRTGADSARYPPGSYLLASQLRPPRTGGDDARPRPWPPPGRDLGQRRRGAARWPATHRSADGSTSSSPREPTAPGPGRTYVAAAAVPLLALAPARGRPGVRRCRRGDPGADPAPGPSPDRRRELRPPGDPAAEGLRVGRASDHLATLATRLRAAAGRAPPGRGRAGRGGGRRPARGGAGAGRRGGRAARRRRSRGDRCPDRPRQRRSRPARGPARRPGGRGGDGQRCPAAST